MERTKIQSWEHYDPVNFIVMEKHQLASIHHFFWEICTATILWNATSQEKP